MQWLILVPLIVVTVGIFYYHYIARRLPGSISQTVLYGKNGKWVLGGCIIVSSICLWLCCLSAIPQEYFWMAWLACASLLTVAFAPISDKDNYNIHTIAAVLAGVMVTLLSAIILPISISVWVLFVVYILASNCEYKLLVAELCCLTEMVWAILSI